MAIFSISEFLEKASNRAIIDVRSPAEYMQGHIPDAINIPLFENYERAVIGKTYKSEGREAAIMKGLEIAGPKLSSLVKRSGEAAGNGPVLVHCWRGGMRSEHFAWLLNITGIHADTLEKGYKNYRNHILSYFNNPMNLILVGGATGSGKTDIINALASLGEQTIDLEGMANHKGSAFGGIGHNGQPTSEQFQNNLYNEFQKLDLQKTIWLENESSFIGKAGLSEGLWKRMTESPIITVDLPKKIRIKRLVREYGGYDHSEIEEAILRIKKKLGGQNLKEAIKSLHSGNLENTARLLLTYYDKTYLHLLERRKDFIIGRIRTERDTPLITAKKLIRHVKEMKHPVI